jgi:glyoxylase-like metal-dependent hydrolase (beta-lactamase superfamily II)
MHEAIVVDPGDDISQITAILDRHQLKTKAIVITHGHIDHVAGASQLRALTGAPVYMNERDRAQLDMLHLQASWLGVPTPPKVEIDVLATDGAVLQLGGIDFEVLLTPGHTEGSLCLWIPQEKKLIAGDTLFRDSIGRTDLPGGDGARILSSIKTYLLQLPDDAVVFPGHGETTSIGRERLHNPFLQRI